MICGHKRSQNGDHLIGKIIISEIKSSRVCVVVRNEQKVLIKVKKAAGQE